MRVGLLIYSEKQIESFISSGFFASIQSLHSTGVLLSDSKLLSSSERNQDLSQLSPLNVLSRKLSTYIQCLELWRSKNISFAHQVRAMNQFAKKKTRAEWSSVIVYEMERWSETRRFILRFLSHNPTFQLIKFLEYLVRKFYILKRWRASLAQFDVLLIPFAGHTSHVWGNSVWLCKKIGVKTIALQENWDNVSSKTVITDEPDFFAVWGTQSQNHLMNIHKISESQIVTVGSPRFEGYFTAGFQPPIASNPNGEDTDLTAKRYILLAGTGDGIDDRMLIDETFKAINLISEPPLVVYRPHPFTRFEHDLDSLVRSFPSIVLDSGPGARKFGHQIPLVKSAALIINHVSTLTLEGLIAEKFVCVPLFLGRSAKIGYDRILDSAPHYVGFSLIQNLLTPRNEHDFRTAILHACQTKRRDMGSNIGWVCKASNYTLEICTILNSLEKSQDCTF
jgi:hypothetical protein